MSTTNFITDPNHHARSEEEDSSGSTDAAVADKSPIDMISFDQAITDPVFWHLSQNFTTRELVQLKRVSRTWTTLLSNNIVITAKARWEDNTKDWYFPLRFEIDPQNRSSFSFGESWTWSGIHHSSGEIHLLPSLPSFLPFLEHSRSSTNVPPSWSGMEFYKFHFDTLIASSGGLLLFMDKLRSTQLEGPVVVREGRGEGRHHSDEAMRRARHEIFKSSAPIGTVSQKWRPLMVSNPLTKEWRVLPAPDCRDLRLSKSWNYHGFQAHMVVDEKANSYKVILTFETSLCVYDSTSNNWVCWAFTEPVPWGFRRGSPQTYGFSDVPSAIVGGKLYFAKLEVDGDAMPVNRYGGGYDINIRTLGHVKMFEIVEEAGTWKPPIQYALRNNFPESLQNPARDYGFRIGSCTIGVVECMGGMYAIIPARLDVAMTMEDEIMRANDLDTRAPVRSYYDFGYLPLQFYVLELHQGAGLAHGQLLIQIPHTQGTTHESEHLRRRNMMANSYDYLSMSPYICWYYTKGSSWFRCTARGSVIWVTWSDYLLQYDVVSGQSKTEILSDTWFAGQPDVSYQPSFHMKP